MQSPPVQVINFPPRLTPSSAKLGIQHFSAIQARRINRNYLKRRYESWLSSGASIMKIVRRTKREKEGEKAFIIEVKTTEGLKLKRIEQKLLTLLAPHLLIEFLEEKMIIR